MRRGCLFFLIIIFGLCLLSCGVIYFVGLPRFQDNIANAFEDAIATEVAGRIPQTVPGEAQPGTYEFTEASLRQNLTSEAQDANVDDILVTITPQGFEIGVIAQDQEATYTGVPTVENGQLVIQDMETDAGWLEFVLPPDKFAEAIEDGVNNYLAQSGLEIGSLELQDGAIVIEAVPAT